MEYKSIVYIVDDDEAVRKALSFVMKSAGLEAKIFASAQAFLESYTPSKSECLVLDVRMPGMSGLELQDVLKKREIHIPVIVITGHGDVPIAVRSMKAGAVDFIEKPFNNKGLLERVEQCLERHVDAWNRQGQQIEYGQRLAQLTQREREVMNELVQGKPNKVVAAKLGISTRTVEAHRAKIMGKLQAKSLSEIVRIALMA